MARRGIPIRIKVRVFHDPEANVYVAVHSNLRGLVAEAATLDQLVANLDAAAMDLLATYLHEPPAKPPISLTLDESCVPA